MNKIERVREKIADRLYQQYRGDVVPYKPLKDADNDWQREFNVRAAEIMRIDGIEVRADDQSLPENDWWHKYETLFEAYCAGRNDMLKAGFKKVEPLTFTEKVNPYEIASGGFEVEPLKGEQ